MRKERDEGAYSEWRGLSHCGRENKKKFQAIHLNLGSNGERLPFWDDFRSRSPRDPSQFGFHCGLAVQLSRFASFWLTSWLGPRIHLINVTSIAAVFTFTVQVRIVGHDKNLRQSCPSLPISLVSVSTPPHYGRPIDANPRYRQAILLLVAWTYVSILLLYYLYTYSSLQPTDFGLSVMYYRSVSGCPMVSERNVGGPLHI